VGQRGSVGEVRTWEVATVTVGGTDGSSGDRDQTVTEEVGLPEHERDESRRRPEETGEDDPAEVAAGTDSGQLDSDALPEHEDDARTATDTATGEQNP
jgi:hypothetical protein